MAHDKKDKRETLVLNGNDVEFFLERVQGSKHLKIRLGHILKVPKRKGTSVLLVDYDDCSGIHVKEVIKRLSACGIKSLRIETKKSPSGRGIHMLVWIHGRYSPFAIIALQCILESDPMREAQNFKRALVMKGEEWQKNGNVLFTG